MVDIYESGEGIWTYTVQAIRNSMMKYLKGLLKLDRVIADKLCNTGHCGKYWVQVLLGKGQGR